MYLLSAKSVLFPTSMIMTSLPLSVLTSSIHFEVCWNEFRSVDAKNTKLLHTSALCNPTRHKTLGVLAIVSVQKQVLLFIKKVEKKSLYSGH